MPTYEYRCPEGHDFERFYRKISDAAGEVACPECGKKAERIMSIGGGFAFKGSGFYLTDYGKNAHRSSAPPAKADTGGDGGSKESASPASSAGSSDTGSSASSTAPSGGESKSVTEGKPASVPKTESKPASSGGSTPKKDT